MSAKQITLSGLRCGNISRALFSKSINRLKTGHILHVQISHFGSQLNRFLLIENTSTKVKGAVFTSPNAVTDPIVRLCSPNFILNSLLNGNCLTDNELLNALLEVDENDCGERSAYNF